MKIVVCSAPNTHIHAHTNCKSFFDVYNDINYYGGRTAAQITKCLSSSLSDEMSVVNVVADK